MLTHMTRRVGRTPEAGERATQLSDGELNLGAPVRTGTARQYSTPSLTRPLIQAHAVSRDRGWVESRLALDVSQNRVAMARVIAMIPQPYSDEDA